MFSCEEFFNLKYVNILIMTATLLGGVYQLMTSSKSNNQSSSFTFSSETNLIENDFEHNLTKGNVK